MGKAKAASGDDGDGWATTKLYAIRWSSLLNCPTFLAEWDTTQVSWIPLLALGSDIADATLWANRLLYVFPPHAASAGADSLLYKSKQHLTVADLFSFFNVEANKSTVLGKVEQHAFVWDFDAADLNRLKFTQSVENGKLIGSECRKFAQLSDSDRRIPQRDWASKQRAKAYMKANKLVVSGKGKSAGSYATFCDEILAATTTKSGAKRGRPPSAAKAPASAERGRPASLRRLEEYELRHLRGVVQPGGKPPDGFAELKQQISKWTPGQRSKRLAELEAAGKARVASLLAAAPAASSEEEEAEAAEAAEAEAEAAAEAAGAAFLTPAAKKSRKSPAGPSASKKNKTPVATPAAETPKRLVDMDDAQLGGLTIPALRVLCQSFNLTFTKEMLKVQLVNRLRAKRATLRAERAAEEAGGAAGDAAGDEYFAAA